MTKKHSFFVLILAGFILGFGATPSSTQENQPDIHVIVNMVQLNVAVTDKKGNYVTGLRPEDFVISEDGINQKIATFGEGDEPTRLVELTSDKSPGKDDTPKQTPVREMPDLPADLPANVRASALGSMIGGSNVFILFDTSNYMYRGFVFAQDAIADFIRSLDSSDR